MHSLVYLSQVNVRDFHGVTTLSVTLNKIYFCKEDEERNIKKNVFLNKFVSMKRIHYEM